MRTVLAIAALALGAPLQLAHAQLASCGDAGAPACAPQAQRRALVIGVSHYPRLDQSKQLRFADADARAFASFLSANDGAHLPASNVRLLVNDSATVSLILRELRSLLRDSRAGDVAIIYFAGHGTEEDGEAPRRAFLLASDAARQSELDIGGIEFSQLQSWLEKFVQKNVRVILVTDACRSGGMAVNEGYTRGAATALQRRFNGVTQLLSSDGDELSMEGEQWGNTRLGKGHGVYTYYLLEGWRGLAADTTTGIVTLRALQDFVRDQVRKATGDKQSPQHSGSLRDTLLAIPLPTLAAMRREDLGNSNSGVTNVVAANNPTRTRDAGSPASRTLDDSTIALVRSLREAIVAGRLTAHDSANAMASYRTLARRPEARAIVPRLTDELVAAMQQDADALIHRYLEGGNDQPRPAAYEAAGRLLSASLELLPPNDPARRTTRARRDFLLGFAIVRANDRPRFAVAEQRLRSAIALEPRAAYAWNALGLLQSALGDQLHAEAAFRAAMAKAPRWQYPVNNLATVYQERRDYGRALATLRAAIALDTLGAAAYNNLGIAYAALGRYDTARSWYHRAIAAQPSLAMARGNLASLYRVTGRRALAHTYIDSAFALLQRDARGGDSLWTLLEAGRLALDELEAPTADSIFARAAVAAPLRPEPFFYRGEAQRALGNVAESERFYRLAAKHDPRYALAYNGLSLLYRSTSTPNYTRALAVLNEAERVLPRSPDVPYYRGWLAQDRMNDTTQSAAQRTASFNSAVADFELTIRRDPLYGSAYSSLGEVYEARDRWSDAERAYTRGVAAADSSADARFALAQHFARRALADSVRRNQWTARERDVLRQLLAIDSAFAPAYVSLAQSEIEGAEFEQAVAHFRAAASLGFANTRMNDAARALQLRGSALEREGALDQAARAYEGARALDATLVDARVGAVRVAYLRGEVARAQVALDSIAPLARDDEERRELALLRARILLDAERPREALDEVARALPRDSSFVSPALLMVRALAASDLAARASDAAERSLFAAAARKDVVAFTKHARTPESRDAALQSLSKRAALRARTLLERAGTQ